jgi:hypothetical protein
MPSKEYQYEIGTMVRITPLNAIGIIECVLFARTGGPYYRVIAPHKYDQRFIEHTVPEEFIKPVDQAVTE